MLWQSRLPNGAADGKANAVGSGGAGAGYTAVETGAQGTGAARASGASFAVREALLTGAPAMCGNHGRKAKVIESFDAKWTRCPKQITPVPCLFGYVFWLCDSKLTLNSESTRFWMLPGFTLIISSSFPGHMLGHVQTEATHWHHQRKVRYRALASASSFSMFRQWLHAARHIKFILAPCFWPERESPISDAITSSWWKWKPIAQHVGTCIA